MLYMPHQTITWKRTKAGLYHGSNDTVIKREKGKWLVYRGRFDFFTNKKLGVYPPTTHDTLNQAKFYG